jgi:NADH:ubiquinone oxidoreductase subunit E
LAFVAWTVIVYDINVLFHAACCRLQGAQHIEHALTEKLGIHIGETTADGMFTLGEMECMGACVNAPMIAIAGAL